MLSYHPVPFVFIESGPKSVNLKCSHILTGFFGYKFSSQFAESYHRILSSALNLKNLISNNFGKFGFYRTSMHILLTS
jgi:hypothetical protein